MFTLSLVLQEIVFKKSGILEKKNHLPPVWSIFQCCLSVNIILFLTNQYVVNIHVNSSEMMVSEVAVSHFRST